MFDVGSSKFVDVDIERNLATVHQLDIDRGSLLDQRRFLAEMSL
jgi:hypothetical protein